MTHQFGHSRTHVTPSHAFIAPDGHVVSPLPAPFWEATQGIVLISPHIGARFAMYLALMRADESQVFGQPSGVQRFIYVDEGKYTLTLPSGEVHQLDDGGFAYLPADRDYKWTTQTNGRLIVFDKRYTVLPGFDAPDFVVGHANDKPSAAFMGDEAAQLKPLLPDIPQFDMAVNLFNFQPGTALPFVETHIMEHGLFLLEGGGVYRLDDRWYPIQAEDVIWMGSYCPQWFGALGKTPSTYLYYKDINRDPVLGV